MHTDKIIFILIFLPTSEKNSNIYNNIEHNGQNNLSTQRDLSQCRCLVPVMTGWDYLYKRTLKGRVGIKVKLLGLYLWSGTCTILYLIKV